MIRKIGLHLFSWCLIWIFFNLFFNAGTTNDQFIFWFSTILSVLSIVASYVFVYNLIPNYLITKQYRKFVVYTLYSFVFVTTGVLMTVTFGFVFFFNLEYQQMPALTKSSSVILVCVVLIIVIASGLRILKHNFKALEEKKSLENKFLQAQLELKEQELKFLKMQIHPHFLFNSLNTIYGFALKKKDAAPEMILMLSNLLDYILYQVDRPTVNLQDEINHLKDYISLEEMRFNDTLKVDFKKENISEFTQIAPMLLIPFVENSFKHGKIVEGKMHVSMHLFMEKGFLCFTIENSSETKNKIKKGIGLENIKKRLEFLYPKSHQLNLSESENKFRVHLKVEIENLKKESNV